VDRVEVDLYAHESNFAVLRLPPRRFPGVLIQGDSLSTLCATIAEIRSAIEAGDTDGALEWVDDLAAELGGRLDGYVAVLDEAGIPLPFNRPGRAAQEPVEPGQPA
jgi:hypothetical protein